MNVFHNSNFDATACRLNEWWKEPQTVIQTDTSFYLKSDWANILKTIRIASLGKKIQIFQFFPNNLDILLLSPFNSVLQKNI